MIYDDYSLFIFILDPTKLFSEVDACLQPAGPFSAAALVSQGAQAGESSGRAAYQ